MCELQTEVYEKGVRFQVTQENMTHVKLQRNSNRFHKFKHLSNTFRGKMRHLPRTPGRLF